MKRQLLLSLILLAHGAPASAMLRAGRLTPLLAPIITRASYATYSRCAQDFIPEESTEPKKVASPHKPRSHKDAYILPYAKKLTKLIGHEADLSVPQLHSFWKKCAPFVPELCTIAVKLQAQDAIGQLKKPRSTGISDCYHATITATRYPDILDYMIHNGAPIDGQAGTYETPLTYAIQHAPIDSIKLLLAAGANPNKGNGYYNPLSLAILNGDTSLLILLLGYGAKRHYPIGTKTPYTIALQRYEDAKELLQLMTPVIK